MASLEKNSIGFYGLILNLWLGTSARWLKRGDRKFDGGRSRAIDPGVHYVHEKEQPVFRALYQSSLPCLFVAD
jgi:hypothetical protein